VFKGVVDNGQYILCSVATNTFLRYELI